MSILSRLRELGGSTRSPQKEVALVSGPDTLLDQAVDAIKRPGYRSGTTVELANDDHNSVATVKVDGLTQGIVDVSITAKDLTAGETQQWLINLEAAIKDRHQTQVRDANATASLSGLPVERPKSIVEINFTLNNSPVSLSKPSLTGTAATSYAAAPNNDSSEESASSDTPTHRM